MKELLRLIFVLTIICVISGSMLAWVHDVTVKPILEAHAAEKLDAIKQVLPEFDNNPALSTCTIKENNVDWQFFVARKDGEFVGAAFETSSSKGYGGTISVMVGVNASNEVHSIVILSHHETPGLGAKIEGDKFKSGIIGKNLTETNWKVKKDGGDVDQITAATISSRAVVGAISAGKEVYIAHESEIMKTGALNK